MSGREKHRKFGPGRRSDSDELQGHVRPVTDGETVNVPEGVFVDVPKGMVMAPGTIVDDKGVMRLDTGELAIWHHRCKFHGECERYTSGPEKFVTLEEVVTFPNGAKWCPDCVEKMADDEQRKQLQEMFRGKKGQN